MTIVPGNLAPTLILRTRRFFGALLVVLCTGVCLAGVDSSEDAGEQNTGEPPRVSMYKLGPDDQVAIRAADVEELDGKPMRIDLRGYLDVPLVGQVKAAGLTVEQFESELTRRLRALVREPKVTVTVPEYRSEPVSVLGAVNAPGAYNLVGVNTLVEVLSRAGGLRTDAGSYISITRATASGPIPLPSAKGDGSGTFSTAQINVRKLLEGKDVSSSLTIQPNDVITVPRADLVYVVGAVNKPGGFVLNERENLSVLQALSMAEGLEKTAAAQHGKIIRRGEAENRIEIPVDVKSILSGQSRDLPLVANDILFVPDSKAKNAALRGLEAAIQIGTGVAIFRH